jgi:ABC-type multidrug transport system fused ATPase/permease subunit
MLGPSIYAYVWRTSRKEQIQICVLVGLIAPLSMLPLELQRRIVDFVVSGRDLWVLALLGAAYLAVVLIQGGAKYVLNLIKGRVLEQVTRDLRRRILARKWSPAAPGAATTGRPMDAGTTISMLAAESEDIGGFASASLSTPLLQTGTIVWVLGYLLWVEPLIAVLAVLVYAPQVLLVPRAQLAINRLARRRTRIIRKLGREAVGYETSRAAAQSRVRTRAG